MINSYAEFIGGQWDSVNEDWQTDFMVKATEFTNSLLSEEEIEDYFLELIDYGFELITKLKIGYLHKGELSAFVSKKAEVVNNQCYPFYEIILIKKFDFYNTTDELRKRLGEVSTFLNKYDIAYERLIYSQGVDLKIIKNSPDFSSRQLRFDMRIMVKKSLPYNFIELDLNPKNAEKLFYANPYNKVTKQIGNNKAFTINKYESSIEENKIVFSVNAGFEHIDVRNIVLRLMRDIEYEYNDLGNNSHEITISNMRINRIVN